MSEDGASVVEPSDLGTGEQGLYARWMREIEAYDKVFRHWRVRVPKIIERFRAEALDAGDGMAYNHGDGSLNGDYGYTTRQSVEAPRRAAGRAVAAGK